MRIPSYTPIPPMAARANPPTPPRPASESAASTRPTESEHAGPPGLQRVLERLQAMPEGERTRGQTQAMTRIERNLQRYLEHQGLAPQPSPSPDEAPDANAPAIPEGDGMAPVTDDVLAEEATPDTDNGPTAVPAAADGASEVPQANDASIVTLAADEAADDSIVDTPVTTGELPDPTGALAEQLFEVSDARA